MGTAQTFPPEASCRGQSLSSEKGVWSCPGPATFAHSEGGLPWWPCRVGHLSSLRDPLLVSTDATSLLRLPSDLTPAVLSYTGPLVPLGMTCRHPLPSLGPHA